MRFLQVHNFYDPYLESFYSARPELARAPFSQQMDALIADGFTGSHIMSPYLAPLGVETLFAVANCRHSQLQWAAENGVTIAPEVWMHHVVMSQIEIFKPDVIYFSHPLDFGSGFIRAITHPVKLIVGWRAAAIPPGLDLSEYDLMLSSDPYTREKLTACGARSVQHFLPGFPRAIADRLATVEKRFDVVFSGQYGAEHTRRNNFLRDVVNGRNSTQGDYSVAYYLANFGNLELPEELARVNRGARWGLEMFRVLREGRIALNAVIDFAKGEAGNMRQFEITGVGSLLLTESNAKLSEHFVPGKEIESYSSREELLEKVRYYLDNPAKREAIAKAGQERCLREHSMEVRAAAFWKLVTERLAVAPRTRGTVVSLHQTPQSPLDRFKAAIHFLQSNAPRQALHLLDEISREGVDYPNLHYARGLAMLKLGQSSSAEEALRNEIARYPDNGSAQELLRDIVSGALT